MQCAFILILTFHHGAIQIKLSTSLTFFLYMRCIVAVYDLLPNNNLKQKGLNL